MSYTVTQDGEPVAEAVATVAEAVAVMSEISRKSRLSMYAYSPRPVTILNAAGVPHGEWTGAEEDEYWDAREAE